MLKGIPSIISPELMKILMEMGHGDEIVLADGNFPAASLANRLVRCDGHKISELLDAVLHFFPLDTYVELPVTLMDIVRGDPITKPKVWDDYLNIVQMHDNKIKEFRYIERFAFYEQAGRAYAIVATGEKARYANIILKKGVVNER